MKFAFECGRFENLEDLRLNVSIILGTRPEIIKMSPVIRACERLGLDYFVLHTGQHYSYHMDRVFFEQLGLADCKYNLDVGSGSHAEQTGKMLIGIEKILQQEQPDAVLVEGDTNTVLAGALAAAKLRIKIGHVEAGLRSYDRGMPEEINRVLTDHSSDFLFAPTEKSKQILMNEGIDENKIFVTGNTIVDAVFQNSALSEGKKSVLDDLGVKNGNYVLVTVHRQENVDNETRLRSIFEGLEKMGDLGFDVVYPIHPRSRKRLEMLNLKPNGVRLVHPLDYLSFLQLERNAKLVLTDSGGVQEEACILGVPCVTLRNNTERPETLSVGANVLAGTKPDDIINRARSMLDCRRGWENPFGNGFAGEQIVQILREKFG